MIGYFGLVIVMRDKARQVAKLGMLWFSIWGLVELVGISIILFSVNKNWRENYVLADATQKVQLKYSIELFYSIWDSLFFLLLVAFLLGTIFFGWATWGGKGIERLLSILFWLAAPLTIIILSGYWSVT